MSGDEKNIVVNRGIPQNSCCSSTATPQQISTIHVVATPQQTKPSSAYFPSGSPAGLQPEQELPTVSGNQNNPIDPPGTVGLDAEIAAAEFAQAQRESGQAFHQAAESAGLLAERQAQEAALQHARQLAADAQIKANALVAAEQSKHFEDHIKHFKAANQLWLAVAKQNPSPPAPAVLLEKIAEAGKRIFIRKATASLARHLPVLAMLYPSDLAPGERPSKILATSASDLGVTDADLEFISIKKGTIEVPHRLMPDITSHNGQFRWVKTDGVKVGSKVRVRPVTYDAHTNTYNFTRDGETTPSLTWTPQDRPENSSTSLPRDSLNLTAYVGAEASHEVPQANLHPEQAAEPDDYILSRPAEVGGGSLYILFKDPRDISGVAKGEGERVSGTWLGESTRNEGAPIPSQIADLLRGRSFSNFDRMRRAMWKAIARDTELSAQFSKLNLSIMKEGNAPYSRPQDQSGGRKKFEIHHKHEVAQGGEVYDFSNLVIMTPAQHIQLHRGKKS
jgi:hypothetical protein